jgi:hypothetical protein
VHVGQYTESDICVFIEYLAFRNAVIEVGGHELLVFQHVLQERTYFLTALGTCFSFEDTVTRRGELFESVSHVFVSCAMAALAAQSFHRRLAHPTPRMPLAYGSVKKPADE